MTTAGHEMDVLVARKIMGQNLENLHNDGDLHPRFSTKIEDAWVIAERMGITLIPIEGGSWFALVGPKTGWTSPAEFLTCLQAGDFMRSGAAVTESAPLSICLAALSAIEKRNYQ